MRSLPSAEELTRRHSRNNTKPTFYDLFVAAGFKGKCAIVTSYEPSVSEISKEDSGAGLTEKMARFNTYRRMLADYFEKSASAVRHVFARCVV